MAVGKMYLQELLQSKLADENHCLYTWDDLDGKRPTMKEYQEQQDERYRNGKD